MPKRKPIDITGQRFGMLTAIRHAGYIKGRSAWLYRCDCGEYIIAVYTWISLGRKKSCGCLGRGPRAKRDYDTQSRTYKKYQQMMQICYNKRRANYRYYGARGITVCAEWKGHPERFIEWALPRGSETPGTSLCRIDKTQGFSPENCCIRQGKTDAEDK